MVAARHKQYYRKDEYRHCAMTVLAAGPLIKKTVKKNENKNSEENDAKSR